MFVTQSPCWVRGALRIIIMEKQKPHLPLSQTQRTQATASLFRSHSTGLPGTVTHSVHGQAWGLNGAESRPPSACQTTCLGAGLCPTAGVIDSAFRNALDGLAAVSLRAEPFNPPSSPRQIKNHPVQISGCAQMVVCQKQP